MNTTLARALLLLAPIGVIFSGSSVLLSKRKNVWSLLQFVGAGSLMIVALAHFCEGLGLFPWMNWGMPDSVGHYLDLCSAILGLIFFPVGYLLQAVTRRTE